MIGVSSMTGECWAGTGNSVILTSDRCSPGGWGGDISVLLVDRLLRILFCFSSICKTRSGWISKGFTILVSGYC